MKRFLKGVALYAIIGLAQVEVCAQNADDHNFDVAKNLEIFHDIVDRKSVV